MASVLGTDYFDGGKTINGGYYVKLLQNLTEEIKQKRRHLAKKEVLFHQDHAYKSVMKIAKINEFKI